MSKPDPLDRTVSFLRRYVAFPSPHDAVAVALWAGHTWGMDSWYTTPRLIVDSPEPGAGKTRLLELLALLTKNPEQTISATTAAIFRMLADDIRTLLFDEVDAIFNPKNGGNYEDLRALLNSGYKRGATVARCVGDARKMKVQRFKVFAPVALAGIAGNMPRAIVTRAVTIHMRPRTPDEPIEQFRERDVAPVAQPIRSSLRRWVVAHAAGGLAQDRPVMPAGVVDRPAEVWEPLLALADRAGGHWPDTARAACQHFVTDRTDRRSMNVRLLADLLALFDELRADRLSTAQIVDALVKDPEAPWGDLHGRPLDARGLGGRLRAFGVESRDLRQDTGRVVKGYFAHGEHGLTDIWRRYLPDSAATSATCATPQVRPVAEANGSPLHPLHDHGPGVADVAAASRQAHPL